MRCPAVVDAFRFVILQETTLDFFLG